MKVAIIFDNFGPYHRARLRAASRAGTLLAVELHRHSREYAWEHSTGPEGFSAVTLGASARGGLAAHIGQARRLGQVLRIFGPECVFVPGWSRAYSWAALGWCRANRVAAVVMSETAEHDSARCAWKEWVKGKIIKLCSGALVGGAPHAEYIAKLGLPSDGIFQGYDVIDNTYFAQAAQAARSRAAELRREFHLPQRYFLACARFIERKNLRAVLDAYAQYCRAVGSANAEMCAGSGSRPWSLVVLGDGEQRLMLERTVRALGLEDRVLLPGFKQYRELPVYYGLADVFVHASTSEPWGLVVNESMACGLPVLVSCRCGCVANLVRAGVNGFTFDPRNVEELAKLLVRTWDIQSQLPAMGNLSARIISNWGPDRFAESVRRAAEHAVGTRAARVKSSRPWSKAPGSPGQAC